MDNFLPIQYRDFYDVPRIFIVVDDGTHYLFNAPFDKAVDDYSDTYAVSVLPPLTSEELAGSWESLPGKAIGHLAPVPVSSVRFDPTLRHAVERSFFRSVVSNERTTLSNYLTLDGQPIDLNIVKAADINEGWIELYEFVSLPDGGKRLVTRMDAEKGAEEPVVHRRSGHIDTFSTAA